MDRPAFAAFVEEWAEPAVLAYLKALDDDVEPAPLLLSDAELEDLWVGFGGEEFRFDKPWEEYPELYRRALMCAADIREGLAKEYIGEWARVCIRCTEQLESGRITLSGGIEVVREWAGEVRRLLRAMGATNFLPAPEGASPTPTSPEPPAPGTEETPAALEGQRSDDELRAALAKAQALQEEIRDLLISQRAVKDWYTTAEVAKHLKRAEYTVREWCRQGRIRAKKKPCGRGKGGEWLVSHEELMRLTNEGLLPPP
jgi:hypothetical protein